MPTYCTSQDLIDRYGEEELIQLTDRTGTGAIDQSVLDQAIADAAAEIDAHLAFRYELPLTEVPAALTRIACEITRYQLYDDAPLDAVKDRYDNALRFLRSVAKGEIRLVQQSGAPAETENFAQVDPGRSVFDNGGGF